MASVDRPPRYSVAGIAFDGGGRLFIARRKAGGDLSEKWEFPGGKREEGEDDKAALKREFREELNVAIEVGPLLATGYFFHKEKEYTLNAYRVFFDAQNFTLAEHTGWRWASFDEIAALDFADSDRLLLPALKTHFDAKDGVKN